MSDDKREDYETAVGILVSATYGTPYIDGWVFHSVETAMASEKVSTTAAAMAAFDNPSFARQSSVPLRAEEE